MSQVFVPHRYQDSAKRFVIRNTIASGAKGGAALFLDPGMGKTAIMLDAINTMFQYRWIRRVLLVAPKRVCYKVWPDEIAKWSNFSHLTYQILHGNVQTRKDRMNIPSHIHIINRDGLHWLSEFVKARRSRYLPWDLLVIDESSQYKNWSARCSQAARDLAELIPYRVIMTGTPSPNGLVDLFPQIWMLDYGASLGENVTQFRKNYCEVVGDYRHNNYKVREKEQEAVHERIQHLCLRLDAQDYLSMPPLIERDIEVDLPADARDTYDMCEEELVVIAKSQFIKELAGRAAALYNSCRQIASGGIYDTDGRAHLIHNEFDEAIVDLSDELQGKPLMIAYHYTHEVERLKKYFPKMRVINGGMRQRDFDRAIDDWNAGKIRHLAVQPQALSYGVNMQSGPGRNIVWYGPTDNLDHYIQLNARLWRQGVTSTVTVHRLRAAGTVHSMIWGRTDGKQDVQSNLLECLRQYALQK